MIEDFHFLRPLWLLALPAVAACAYLARRGFSAGSQWSQNVAPELLAVLLEKAAATRYRYFQPIVTAALMTAAVAAAGPTWQRLPQPVERSSDAVVVVLDLSLSMYAQDVNPSRIDRAKNKVVDLLRRRQEGFTGLVVFAGDAYTVAPLTDDTRTIENLLAALRPNMMPVLGSQAARGVEEAMRLFRNAGLRQGRIVLVTDGVDQIADVTDLRDANFPLSILAVGSAEGAPIPLDFLDQAGRFLETDDGVTVHVRLDADRLATIAAVAYGHFAQLTVSDADLDAVLSAALPARSETVAVEREFDTWHDAGYWFLLPLLVVAAIGFRRGVLAALAIVVIAPAGHAEFWDDLWLRADQQAHRVLENGDADSAAVLFENSDWRAVAQFRAENYADAAAGFRQDASASGAYNLGNSLARLGALAEAVAAYDVVLARQPGHADAQHNKALVENLLEQQNQSGGDQTDESSSPADANQRDSMADANSSDSQADGSEDPASAEQMPNEGAEHSDRKQAESAQRDEGKDATEQWLRRVPDDPGGLLRRKFQYQANQRLREGDYRSRQTERIW